MNDYCYLSEEEEDITFVDAHSQLESVSSRSRSSNYSKEHSLPSKDCSRSSKASNDASDSLAGGKNQFRSKSLGTCALSKGDDDEFDNVARSRQQHRRSLFQRRQISDGVEGHLKEDLSAGTEQTSSAAPKFDWDDESFPLETHSDRFSEQFKSTLFPPQRRISKPVRDSSIISITLDDQAKRKTSSKADISDDRPTHWQQLNKNNTLAASRLSSEKKRRSLNGGNAVSHPTKKPRKSGLPIIKPLPPQSQKDINPSGISGLCFQPAWINFSAGVSASKKSQFDKSASNAEDIVDTDNDDDAADVIQNSLQIEGHSSVHDNIDSSPQFQITRHTHNMSPPVAPSSRSFNSPLLSSNEKAARIGSNNTKLGRVKPGTIRATLQKVFRDIDAKENRIMNLKNLGNKMSPFIGAYNDSEENSSQPSYSLQFSGNSDLQDPRCRSHFVIDAVIKSPEYDRVPFKSCTIELLDYWEEAKQGKPTLDDLIRKRSLVTAYFKPDTCVGKGRKLSLDSIIRVYDPVVLDDARSWIPRMICTNCWEVVQQP